MGNRDGRIKILFLRNCCIGEQQLPADMKGILKGFKKFVHKEHELEIGYPTDVRHVAHIGWEGTSASPPSWMREFQTAPEFSSSSLSNVGQSGDQCSSQEIQQSMGLETSEKGGDSLPKGRKKTKRKKTKITSPSSSSRSPSGLFKSKASYNVAKTEVGVENQIEVS